MFKEFKRKLKCWVYGGDRELNSVENACLSAVLAKIDRDAARVISAQLKVISHVQRQNPKGIVLFSFLSEDLQKMPLFLNTSPDLYAAKVGLSSKTGMKLSARLICHRGRIHSLEFTRVPARELEEGLRVDSVELLSNLSEPSQSSQLLAGPAQSRTAFAELGDKYALLNVKGPPSVEQFRILRTAFDCDFPEDYLELVQESDGFRIGEWEYYGCHPRSVVSKEGTCVILAEADTVALCLKEGTHDRVIYHLDQIDDDWQPIGTRFLVALEQVLESKLNQ